MGGEVDVRSLRLKKNAFNKFGLPVVIQEGFSFVSFSHFLFCWPILSPIHSSSGYLGRVKLEIPWTNLSAKPVVIQLEDIFASVRLDVSGQNLNFITVLSQFTFLTCVDLIHHFLFHYLEWVFRKTKT
jgi:hypothetical protein